MNARDDADINRTRLGNECHFYHLFEALCSFLHCTLPIYLFCSIQLNKCSWFTPKILFCNLQSEVFAVAFALLAAGAVILTLNVLLLVFFSLSNSLALTFGLVTSLLPVKTSSFLKSIL